MPPRIVRLLVQVLLVAACLAALAGLVNTTARHLAERGIRSGFDFLLEPAGFSIGESPLPFAADDILLRAFAVGLLNTLRVALPGALLALGIGVAVGLLRLSANPLARGLGMAYVQVFRNLPLLLQLLAGYFILTDLLPAIEAPLHPLPGVFLSKSGLALPWWGDDGLDWPVPGDFGVDGGARLTPEYLALLLGLALYSAAYIAENLRAAVSALPAGQTLAGLALGMRPRQTFFLVLLPQAWRAALPPVTSQLINLAKNASLGVAIGYPDLVSIAGTTLNQTGRAVECLSLVVVVYLGLSLAGATLSRRLERTALGEAA